MYWKATLENINNELKDKHIITEYYGYIDREVYPEWDTEVAKEIYLYLEEQVSNEDEYEHDIEWMQLLSRTQITVEEITKEEYDLKTS